eukprot:scaffold53921_cov31-Tisochrysis_lutea.AAC.4
MKRGLELKGTLGRGRGGERRGKLPRRGGKGRRPQPKGMDGMRARCGEGLPWDLFLPLPLQGCPYLACYSRRIDVNEFRPLFESVDNEELAPSPEPQTN